MKERTTLSYRLTRYFVFILVVAAPLIASAEPTESWVARYNGLGNGLDNANAIAIDTLGNVYVTGQSDGGILTGYDYATVKYAPDGTQLWARYNSTESDDDSARAIAIDAEGNVYVTGQSDDDYATVKYAPDGTQLWVKQYNGPGNGSDNASAIAIDAEGNVYVTGQSWGIGTDADYATVKYDTNGNELWDFDGEVAARYDAENYGDFASAIAVDASGNIYVTGSSEESETGSDYATVKYAPDGTQLWVKRYNGLEIGDDSARAIALDQWGNICVTGQSDGNYATVKYAPDGTQLWVKQYNGPGNGLDDPCAIAVDLLDPSGNVYVTGQSWGIGTDADYATVKYDTNGNELWDFDGEVAARYDAENYGDFASAIAVDSSGNVCVTGQSWGSETGSDYATVKYAPDGTQLWVKRYNGPGNGSDNASAIALDRLGNVHVTGQSEGDYATVKYREVDEVPMGLPAGWSMISLPVTPADATVTSLFPDAVVVYKYQKGKGYVRVPGGENLEVGMGYWILLENPRSYVIRGATITEYTTSVADGWYMIGGCTEPAQTMVISASGRIAVIYGYTRERGYTRILESESLVPGKGYWIFFCNTTQGAAFTAKIEGMYRQG